MSNWSLNELPRNNNGFTVPETIPFFNILPAVADEVTRNLQFYETLSWISIIKKQQSPLSPTIDLQIQTQNKPQSTARLTNTHNFSLQDGRLNYYAGEVNKNNANQIPLGNYQGDNFTSSSIPSEISLPDNLRMQIYGKFIAPNFYNLFSCLMLPKLWTCDFVLTAKPGKSLTMNGYAKVASNFLDTFFFDAATLKI